MYPFERTDNNKIWNVQRSDLERDRDFRLWLPARDWVRVRFSNSNQLRFLDPRFGREGSSDLMIWRLQGLESKSRTYSYLNSYFVNKIDTYLAAYPTSGLRCSNTKWRPVPSLVASSSPTKSKWDCSSEIWLTCDHSRREGTPDTITWLFVCC